MICATCWRSSEAPRQSAAGRDSAVKISTVGGDKLTIKTGDVEFSAPLTQLHDGWWNSIARAME